MHRYEIAIMIHGHWITMYTGRNLYFEHSGQITKKNNKVCNPR